MLLWLLKLTSVSNPDRTDYFFAAAKTERGALRKFREKHPELGEAKAGNKCYEFTRCAMPTDVEQEFPSFVTANPSEFFHDNATEKLVIHRVKNEEELVEVVKSLGEVACITQANISDSEN